MLLTYFLCKGQVPGGLKGLKQHFNLSHGILVTSAREEGFICYQGDCQAKYFLFSSLKRHISRHHIGELQNAPQVQDNSDSAESVHEGDIVEQPDDINHSDNSSDSSEHEPDVIGEAALTGLVAETILKLRANSSITGSVLTTMLDSMSDVLEQTRKILQTKVRTKLDETDLDDMAKQSILSVFNFSNPFDSFCDLRQQVILVKEHFNFVEPIEMPLTDREELVMDPEGNDYRPRFKKNTFQYIPILETIRLVLSKPDIREHILNERPSSDNIMRSFIDGDTFKIHELFSTNPHALRLQIYYDDLEVVSALGSKTSIHKLGAFYFRILNIPQHLNSLLGSVHLFILCHSLDAKKGFKAILRPFMQDINLLERGYTFTFDAGETCTLKGTIAAFCGDGLATHEVFGFLGPSADRFCRLCLIRRREFHEFSEVKESRTKENYAEHLAAVLANPRSSYDSGVKEECALHQSQFFHVTTNYVFDPMHDLLEGICPYELKLIINYYVYGPMRRFTVEDLNSRIASFNYGFVEMGNRPSANLSTESIQNLADHKLKQRAAQMWCLMRAFPFLVSDWVPEGDRHMDLVLNLLSIMDVVFAYRVGRGMLAYLETLIREHHLLFKELYPERNPINKHHHLDHYPKVIKEFGPIILNWCMRFEGKHNTLSRHGRVMNNFINPCETLARVCQLIQCHFWGTKKSVPVKLSVVSGKDILMEHAPIPEDLEDNGIFAGEYVTKALEVSVQGNTFRAGLFVVIGSGVDLEDNLPVFGKIINPLVFEIGKFC